MITGPELIDKVQTLAGKPVSRRTLYTMISHHVTADRRPTSIRVRFLTVVPSQDRALQLRLFRPGDAFHPDRANGPMAPDADELPPEFGDLVDWYWKTVNSTVKRGANVDALAQLRGLGKDLWRSLGGTRFIDELRSNWFDEVPGRKTKGIGQERHPHSRARQVKGT
jgi:hypothetical protein